MTGRSAFGLSLVLVSKSALAGPSSLLRLGSGGVGGSMSGLSRAMSLSGEEVFSGVFSRAAPFATGSLKYWEILPRGSLPCQMSTKHCQDMRFFSSDSSIVWKNKWVYFAGHQFQLGPLHFVDVSYTNNLDIHIRYQADESRPRLAGINPNQNNVAVPQNFHLKKEKKILQLHNWRISFDRLKIKLLVIKIYLTNFLDNIFNGFTWIKNKIEI